MPSALDTQLNRHMDALLVEGSPFETGSVTRFGQELPVFKNAPPSLAHYIMHYSQEHKDTIFLVDGDVRLTFGEAYAAARTLAGGLVEGYGVKAGDRVGIVARNSANWIVAYMAVILAGGCATLLNGWWTGEEMQDGIALADCSLLLADRKRAQRLDGMTHGAKTVLFDHGKPPLEGLSALLENGGDAQTQLPLPGPDDGATILYTSGSTGQSKAAWSDHRAVVHGVMSYVAQSVMSLGVLSEQGKATGEQPSALVAVPLFHVTGEVPLFLQSFALGRKLVLIPKWDPVVAMKAMEAERINYFVGVPLMSYEIATHPDREKYDLSACRSFAAGGAPRPVEHVNRIKDAFPEGFPLLGYGLTETNAVGCGNFNENYMDKPGSTGMPSRPLVDLAILDESGKPLPSGSVGEVAIRSICNFNRYWKNDEATREAITSDGYFLTGDLGYLDEDDYLYIVDRKKDIIIRGGENISCLEVEQAIYAHSDIAECSVFGLPDDRLGEVPAAIYLPKDGKTVSPDDLTAFLSDHLAKFKIPQTMWVADEPLPRLGTEKVDRKKLRERFTAELTGA